MSACASVSERVPAVELSLVALWFWSERGKRHESLNWYTHTHAVRQPVHASETHSPPLLLISSRPLLSGRTRRKKLRSFSSFPRTGPSSYNQPSLSLITQSLLQHTHTRFSLPPPRCTLTWWWEQRRFLFRLHCNTHLVPAAAEHKQTTDRR